MKLNRNTEVAVVLLVVLLGLILAGFLPGYHAPSKFKVYGITQIGYTDGTTQVINSAQTSILGQSVISTNGKIISSLSEHVYGTWSVSGAPSANVQYFVYYYVNITGPFYYGGRIFTSLTGYTNIPVTNYPSLTITSNPWLSIENGANPSDAWLEDWYYQVGSGTQIGPYNTAGVLASVVTNPHILNANTTNSVTSSFEALLGVQNITNGKSVQLTQWSETGPGLYTNLMQTSWGGPLGFSVGAGSVSVGNGYFATMAQGNNYQITFAASYLYRWQDVTGQWSPWVSGTANLGTLSISVSNGYWVSVYFTPSSSQSVS
ncbi:MAG: hypothetical protein JRM78_02615 [Nitrososphaerota archaeon]|nr:hypothetical protein [Nitrososphaerota archaeon]